MARVRYKSSCIFFPLGKDLGIPESTVRSIIDRREKLKKLGGMNEAIGSSDSESQTKIKSSAIGKSYS